MTEGCDNPHHTFLTIDGRQGCYAPVYLNADSPEHEVSRPPAQKP